MINIERLHARENSELETLTREEDRRKAKITRNMDAQLKRVSAGAESKREAVRENYARIGSIEVLSQLIEDYQMLQDRENAPVQVDEKEIDSAKDVLELRKLAERIKKETGSDVQGQFYLKQAEMMQKQFGISDAAIAVAEGKRTGFEPSVVSSYMGFDKGIVYMITPTCEQEEHPIAKSLELKLFDIVSTGTVSMGESKKYEYRTGRVVGKDTSIEFNPERAAGNGFVVYTLEPKEAAAAIELAAQIKEKLEALQPEAFKDVKLEHKVNEVDARIIKYLITHGREEILHSKDALAERTERGQHTISYKEAAEVLNKDSRALKNLVRCGIVQADENDNIVISSLSDYLNKPKRDSSASTQCRKNQYQSTEPKEVRAEALGRLAEVSDNFRVETIGPKQTAYVFGTGPDGGAWSVARRPYMEKFMALDPDSKHKKWVFNVKGLKHYIENSKPRKYSSGFSWNYKPDGSGSAASK